MIEIRPQPGPQHQFLESTADLVFYGRQLAAPLNTHKSGHEIGMDQTMEGGFVMHPWDHKRGKRLL